MDNELRIRLIDVARERRLVGYGKIMFSYGLNSNDRRDVDLFADWIAEISEWEHKRGRPMLSSLVMHSDLRSIGTGFYTLAEKLLFGDSDYLQRTLFEKEMQKRCYECWSNDDLYQSETGKKSVKKVLPYPLYPEEDFPEGVTDLKENKLDFFSSEVDWLENHRQNIFIGSLGEELVIEYEKRVLIDNGFENLALKVEKVTDGMGFDVLSFNLHGEEKYIEVKTTTGDRNSPFYISINEVHFSQRFADRFHLYRLYSLNVEGRHAHFNCYSGDLRNHFHLSPNVYTAYNKKRSI